MIDKKLLTETVEKALEGTDMFLVDARIEPGNRIVVEIDSPDSIDIDACATLTRKIEAVFDRDVEDYELEVGSAGLTSPFKVKGQYLKNVGNEIEVLTRDGRKLRGTLSEVGDEGFTLVTRVKVKEEGKKRPVEKEEPVEIAYSNVKSACYLIDFK